MRWDVIRSPFMMLRDMAGSTAYDSVLQEYEAWWEQEGRAISDAVDRALVVPHDEEDERRREADHEAPQHAPAHGVPPGIRYRR